MKKQSRSIEIMINIIKAIAVAVIIFIVLRALSQKA